MTVNNYFMGSRKQGTTDQVRERFPMSPAEPESAVWLSQIQMRSEP